MHVIGYGFAGVDLRYALEQDKTLQDCVETLVTVNSPHAGSLLSSLVSRGKVKVPYIEQVMNIMGVDADSFREVNEDNMEDFNSYLLENEAQRVGLE